MTNEEAARIIQSVKTRVMHSDRNLVKDMPYTREQINQAFGMAIGYLFRSQEGTDNRFDEMVRITDVVEEKTGHRYELIYDHSEPDVATLIFRGNK